MYQTGCSITYPAFQPQSGAIMAPKNSWLIERIPRSYRPAGWETGSVTSEDVERAFVAHNTSFIHGGLSPGIRPSTPPPQQIAAAQAQYQRYCSSFIHHWLDTQAIIKYENIGETPQTSFIGDQESEISELTSVATEELDALEDVETTDATTDNQVQQPQSSTEEYQETDNSDDTDFHGSSPIVRGSSSATSHPTVSHITRGQAQLTALQTHSSLQLSTPGNRTLPQRPGFPNYHLHHPDALHHPENYMVPVDPNNTNAREAYWQCTVCGMTIRRREKITRHIQCIHGKKVRLN
jgi:hypothetical protein